MHWIKSVSVFCLGFSLNLAWNKWGQSISLAFCTLISCSKSIAALLAL